MIKLSLNKCNEQNKNYRTIVIIFRSKYSPFHTLVNKTSGHDLFPILWIKKLINVHGTCFSLCTASLK